MEVEHGTFLVFKMPAGTPPHQVDDAHTRSRSMYGWPHSYSTEWEDDETGERIVEHHNYDRDRMLAKVVDVASHLYYGSVREDTWITDGQGNPVAIIKFKVEINLF